MPATQRIIHAPTTALRPRLRPTFAAPTVAAVDLAPPDIVAQPGATDSIIEQHPPAPAIQVTHETVVEGRAAEALWEMYCANFEPLTNLAALEHFYDRAEILAELANPRIVKIVGWRGDRPIGLAMVTNSLDDVPQISPAFLRERYPQHAARAAIYFGILVMVAQDVRRLTLFSRLSTELWQVAALDGGVLVFDVCDFNRLSLDAEALAHRIADSFPRSEIKVLDRQTWFVAELPEPIPSRPPA